MLHEQSALRASTSVSSDLRSGLALSKVQSTVSKPARKQKAFLQVLIREAWKILRIIQARKDRGGNLGKKVTYCQSEKKIKVQGAKIQSLPSLWAPKGLSAEVRHLSPLFPQYGSAGRTSRCNKVKLVIKEHLHGDDGSHC